MYMLSLAAALPGCNTQLARDILTVWILGCHSAAKLQSACLLPFLLPAVRRELLLPITMTSPEPSRAVFWGLRKSMLLLAIGTEWDRETFDGVKPFWTLRGSDWPEYLRGKASRSLSGDCPPEEEVRLLQ